MSNKRKIDRFFEKDINNENTKVIVVSFFFTHKYRDYLNSREEYLLNCENSGKVIPLKQESEYKQLPLIERLVLDKIKDYDELYSFVGMYEENRREEVKDILESLFKKGLIEFELSKTECINVKIDNYYSDFFKEL